jgi:hypothetical protein
MADTSDRRLQARIASSELKRQLNGAQIATCHTLERFGWEVKFIRRDPGREPLVVLHDPDTRKFAILDANGVLEENPVFHKFRSG